MKTNPLHFVLGGVLLAAISASAASVSIDLTSPGASGMANGATFVQNDSQSTGTGVLNPFVRIQDNGIEDGFNTHLADTMPDVKAGTWTHEILLSAVPIVTLGGIDYYQFALDINQNSGGDNELLSLNSLEIWTHAGELAEANDHGDLAGGGAVMRWSLDAIDDVTIELDYSLDNGSGSGDMFAYIPVSAFALAATTDNLYLYSSFGVAHAGNDGFEEWGVIGEPTPQQSVPDGGATIMLLGAGLSALGMGRRFLKR